MWGSFTPQTIEERDVKGDVKGRYRHYKGDEYEVIGIGLNTETNERMVLYKPLYELGPELREIDGNLVFCRPYIMFFEKVTVDGREVDRFTKLLDW